MISAAAKRRIVPCFLFVLSAVCAFPDRYEEVKGSGLFLTSEPPGARVFIDGIERGNTPLDLASLREGEYGIRITKDGFVERRFRAIIRKGSRLEIEIRLDEARGYVSLSVRFAPAQPSTSQEAGSQMAVPAQPAGSQPSVYADALNVSLEKAPSAAVYSAALKLAAGWHTLTAEAFGWETESRNIYLEAGSVQTVDFILRPAAFRLEKSAARRRRFNPAGRVSAGAEMDFEVSAPGSGILEILDEFGKTIYSESLNPFTARRQRCIWNGRDAEGRQVQDGLYTARLSVWDAAEETRHSAEFSLRVDYSLAIWPLSLAAASGGLLFAPAPQTLPAGSFQVEGSLAAGRPPGEAAWASLPFAVGFRAAIIDRLELAAAFNAAPRFESSAPWGLGASLKWAFTTSPSTASPARPLQAAAELSYGWASAANSDAGPYTAFGLGTGAALRFPLAVSFVRRAGQGNAAIDGAAINGGATGAFLSLLASPFVLWAGKDGYPQSAAPRLGISSGVLAGAGYFSGGLSFRWDYGTDGSGPGPAVSALELKFFPSNLVISLFGGLWRRSETGVFFGAGIGCIL